MRRGRPLMIENAITKTVRVDTIKLKKIKDKNPDFSLSVFLDKKLAEELDS
jgi:hypothetical protein